MIESFLLWLTEIVHQLGYMGLVILMALESTFIPLPSELILPPAGYLVFQGKMNFIVVLLCGITGSVLGAVFNYWLGARYGKRVIVKILHIFHMQESHYYSAELFFKKHGEVSTFVGRLLLGVRHFISFPAGVAKMKLLHFIFYTALGAALWSVILVLLGYYVGEQEALLHRYYHEVVSWLIVFCTVVVFLYVWWYKRKSQKLKSKDQR